MKHILVAAALLPLAACSNEQEPKEPATDPALEAYLENPLAYTRAQIAEVLTRPEHEDPIVEVQHILVSFQGAPKMTDAVTRSTEDAELFAVELYGRVLRGEDFQTLSEQHSDDPGSGNYLLTLNPGGALSRGGMAKRFGDVCWRLQVGEIGIAAHDLKESPYGWHIIKRLR